MRTDRKRNHLWQIRQALWTRNANWKEEFQKDIRRLSESLGYEPDLDAVGSIYQVDGLTTSASMKQAQGKLLKVYVDGVAIRMAEDRWGIHAMVEGSLAEAKLKAFQEGVLAKLSRLEGANWQIEPMGSRD